MLENKYEPLLWIKIVDSTPICKLWNLKQVSRACISNYMKLWDVITYAYPRDLLLATKSSHHSEWMPILSATWNSKGSAGGQMKWGLIPRGYLNPQGLSDVSCHLTANAPVPLSRMLSANQYELAFVAHRTVPYWFELLPISSLPLSC